MGWDGGCWLAGGGFSRVSACDHRAISDDWRLYRRLGRENSGRGFSFGGTRRDNQTNAGGARPAGRQGGETGAVGVRLTPTDSTGL